MGIIALPAMLKRRYSPELACGCILAGGSLGILIPPSVMAILIALVVGLSIGELFVGAVFPGLLLAGIYILYITVRCYINPQMGPALPLEERVDFREKLRLLRGIIAPLTLVSLVLGIIFTGVATPVEAAGIGTFGALFVMGLHRRLTWVAIREAALMTVKYTVMVLWIIFGASIFVGFYIVQGGTDFVGNTLLGLGLGPYGILVVMMVLLVILGMFLDWVGIMFLALPIFAPIVNSLAWDGVLGLPGVAPRRGADLVRRGLHAEHADVLSEPAIRLCTVLSQERRRTRRLHGNHLSLGHSIPGASGHGPGHMRNLSRNHSLAASPTVRIVGLRVSCRTSGALDHGA